MVINMFHVFKKVEKNLNMIRRDKWKILKKEFLETKKVDKCMGLTD